MSDNTQNDQTPTTCPFCGAAEHPHVMESLTYANLFRCGTRLGCRGSRSRTDQSHSCVTDERERLTRERDEAREERDQALMLLGVYKTKSGDLLARVKRLEDAGDVILWYFRPKDTGDISFLQSEAIKQWTKAKEANP